MKVICTIMVLDDGRNRAQLSLNARVCDPIDLSRCDFQARADRVISEAISTIAGLQGRGGVDRLNYEDVSWSFENASAVEALKGLGK